MLWTSNSVKGSTAGKYILPDFDRAIFRLSQAQIDAGRPF